MTRHAEIEKSAAAAKIPILHDCAAGIADVQVRNRGTIGGSLAEADPSGDWAAVLFTLTTEVRCLGPTGRADGSADRLHQGCVHDRLAHDELVSEVIGENASQGKWRRLSRIQALGSGVSDGQRGGATHHGWRRL